LEWISQQKVNNGEVLGVNINCNQHHLLSEMTPQELVAEFCLSLFGMLERRKGLSLMFISHDLRGDVSDFTLAAEIADRLAKTHPQRIRNVTVPISAAEIKAICGELDAVITGRLHLAIAALGAGTPVGGIAYLGKFEGLFQHFELRGLSIPPRRKSIRKMADLGSSILDRREEIAAQIQQHWPDVRQLSLKNL
jgi:polysaccharide pyruvyl transferase WcaK-like protein